MMLTKCKWSAVSIVVSLAGALVTFAAVMYLGRVIPDSRADRVLGLMNGSTLICSFVTAVVGLFKDPSPRYGLIALALCFLSFFLYVR